MKGFFSKTEKNKFLFKPGLLVFKLWRYKI